MTTFSNNDAVTGASDWDGECMRWIGQKLTGRFAHYCNDWDGLPIDETCSEFGCCDCAWLPVEERPAKERAREEARKRFCAEAGLKP